MKKHELILRLNDDVRFIRLAAMENIYIFSDILILYKHFVWKATFSYIFSANEINGLLPSPRIKKSKNLKGERFNEGENIDDTVG